MDSSIVVAVIVGGMAVVGQQLLSRSNARQRREEKQEDWDRQDAVAAKAAEAADLLLAENKKVAATAVQTQRSLSEIHTLVNSNMTAAMQGQLVALKAQLALMERLAGVKSPTYDEKLATAGVVAQIAELEAALNDRLAATEVVENARREG